MTVIRVANVMKCRRPSILAKAIATVCCLSMTLLFTSSPALAELIFSEDFDHPQPPDMRVLFEADAIYDGIADPVVTGGDATPNDYYNGMIVRSWGGLITSDQHGDGFFLHNRTTCDFVPTDYQGQFWGTLGPIEVVPSSSYAFSFYLTNENTVLAAQIQLRINDQDIGPPMSAKGRHATNGWQRFTVQWDSGDATTADLSLFNVLSDCNGNDFGTDTITFTLVPEPSSIGLAAIAGSCFVFFCRSASDKSRQAGVIRRGAGQPASRDRRALWTVVAVSVVAIVTLFCDVPTCRAATIFDGGFADDDWTHELVYDDTPSGGEFTTAQANSGGNPGTYQGGTHTWGDGSIYVAHLFQGAETYDPSSEGAIALLHFSHDFIVLNTELRHVATGLVLKQDGDYFIAPATPPFLDFVSGASWTSAADVFTCDNFRKLTSGGISPGAPNFTSTGAPIQFGYATLNTTQFASVVTRWGIDNFSVNVTSVPEPSAIVLLWTSAVCLFGYRWRSVGVLK